MDKLITVSDRFTMGDRGLMGKVVLRDGETGYKIWERNNLIVLRGRTFALECIFGTQNTDETETGAYLKVPGRKLSFFMVGKGGTVPQQPFQSIAPSFSDVGMTDPVPFRLVDPGDPETALSEVGVYFGQTIRDDGMVCYSQKLFESIGAPGQWSLDRVAGTVYRMITLRLNEKDIRYTNGDPAYVPQVNEIGLFFASEVKDQAGTLTGFTDAELFSRITFPTEALAMDSKKSLIVEYFIYA